MNVNLILQVILNTLLIFTALIIYTRIVGLRSFSKMTPIDFAMTIAIGSMLATTILSNKTDFLNGALSIAAVFLLQLINSNLRRLFPKLKSAMENSPYLLMENGVFLEENLKKTNVTKSDIYGKLREANALDLEKVKAVVFEPTGDISVLHGDSELDSCLLESVKR